MHKWCKQTMLAYMHACLKKNGLRGEAFEHPIYGVVNDYFGCYVALTNQNRILLAEFTVLTGSPVNLYAFSLDSLISVKAKKNILGQYKFILTFNTGSKNQKLNLLVSKKLLGSDFTEQEQNLMKFVELFENLSHKLEY